MLFENMKSTGKNEVLMVGKLKLFSHRVRQEWMVLKMMIVTMVVNVPYPKIKDD